MSDTKRVKFDHHEVQFSELTDNILEHIVKYLPWTQQYSMRRVTKRFEGLKCKDKETYNLCVKEENIPDDGKTIFEVIKMLPNLTQLYQLDHLNTRGQFHWYNDLLVVGEPNGTEEILARHCPRIEEFNDDWSEYDTDNRTPLP